MCLVVVRIPSEAGKETVAERIDDWALFVGRLGTGMARAVDFQRATIWLLTIQDALEAVKASVTCGPTGTTNSGRRGIEVPGVLGISLSEARETLEAADLLFLVRPGISDEPPGTILWQSPRQGERLLPGDSVNLVVADERPRCYEYAESC